MKGDFNMSWDFDLCDPVTKKVLETEEKHETPKQTMVDPTSVWGLNDNQDNQRRNAKLAEPKKDQESFDAFGNDGQDSISQIETSAQDDDDDNSDIPFFKHRGEN